MILSIVIPTKDRYPCLKETVKALVRLNLPDTEIIIQDNTEDNSEVCGFFDNYEQVKYFHVSEKISVTENSDLAIEQATGKYVVFLGDDDALTPETMKILKYMDDYNIEACCAPYGRYNWPNLMEDAGIDNSVELLYKSDGSIEKIDCAHEISRYMKITKMTLRIPKVYQGIIRRDLLNKIHDITGTYAPGPSPDLANGTAVSLLAKRVIMVNAPFIVAGYSKKSASGLWATKNHVARIEDVPWLSKETAQEWDSRIPRVWTTETIWAETFIKALQKMGHDDMVKNYSFTRMYSTFYIAHRPLRKFLNEVSGYSAIRLALDLPFYICERLWNKVWIRISHTGQHTSLSKDRIDIYDAIMTLQDYIDNHPIDYSYRA